MVKVLITGGTGFIGFHLLKHLLKQGHELTIIDNFFRSEIDRYFSEYASQIKLVVMDLTKPLADHPELDDHYEIVFHLAAINGVKYANQIPAKVLRTNILATINLLDWCEQIKPRSILFASSSEVYNGALNDLDYSVPTIETLPIVLGDLNNPRNSYSASKIIGESLITNYAKSAGINSRIVRYHNIYGPRMGRDHVIPELISRIHQKENPFKLYGADQTRAFCYVQDAVEATADIAFLQNKKHITVNIGNANEEIKIMDLCKKIFKLHDYAASIEELPGPPGSPDRRSPSTSKLEAYIGFKPRVSLDEGLLETYKWYKENLALT